MAMKNSELRTLLTAKLGTLSAKASSLSSALTKITPQALSLNERKILNELGMTVPFETAPDNPQASQIRAALETIAYHTGQIKATLDALPNDNKNAAVTLQNVMAWDMVGDSAFAGI